MDFDQEALRQQVKASVISSNGILSDQEDSVARELLRGALNSLSTIEAEIKSLEEQRAEQVEWITRLRAGVSARKRVPPEILGKFFNFCVDGESNIITIPLHPMSPCLALSQVCSQWRQVALAEPSLWNVISVDNPSAVHPNALEVLLSRAGNAITFCLALVSIPPPVLRIIHQYSDNFQTVKLCLASSQEVEYLNVPFERLGALHRLQLCVGDRYNGTIELYRVTSAFANTSNPLRFELLMQWIGLDLRSPTPLHYPWLNLEHLMLHCYVELTEFLHILAHCTWLVSCEATLHGVEDDRTFLPVTLTNLSSLTLATYGLGLDRALEALTTPALTKFKTKNTFIALTTFAHFIERSGCNLQTVEVSIRHTPSQSVTNFLLCIPAVIVLTFTVASTNSAIDTILGSIGTGALLPYVEVLEFCASSCTAVQALVLSRCEPSSDGSKKVIQKLTAWVWKNDVTREWEEFQASLPEDGPVRIKFGLPYI